MIKLLVQLLAVDDFYGKSKNIDIAKGSNEFSLSLKKNWKQYKREKAWQKK